MTPPYEASDPYKRSPSPIDKLDAAYSPPSTPDQKSFDVTGRSWQFNCNLSTYVHSGLSKLAGIHDIELTMRASDEDIPDNYVSATIAKQKYLPPVTWKNLLSNLQWISLLAITVTPTIAIYGMFTTKYNVKTALWA